MQINLVTSNLNKVREFKAILGSKIKINHIEMHYKELRSDSNEEIAIESAERLAKQLKKNVVVEDSGLFIDALNGFPGACSAFVHKRIGLNGILKLMEGSKDRTCYYNSAVAYCEPNKKATSFSVTEKGLISEKIKGIHGFGHDSIFIPQGSKKTYGEIENCEIIKKFRRIAVLKLKNYLLSKKA